MVMMMMMMKKKIILIITMITVITIDEFNIEMTIIVIVL